jgi:hypothetical protein
VEVKPSHAWKLSGYADLYKHAWLEYRSDAPSYGTDILAQITYEPSRNFQIYARYKQENSNHNLLGEYMETQPMDFLTEVAKSTFRVHVSHSINKSVTLKTRLEISAYDENAGFPEKGYLLFQDVSWQPLGKSYGVSSKLTFFNTDSYNTRIYVYETDVLYAYSIVALHGRAAVLIYCLTILHLSGWIFGQELQTHGMAMVLKWEQEIPHSRATPAAMQSYR